MIIPYYTMIIPWYPPQNPFESLRGHFAGPVTYQCTEFLEKNKADQPKTAKRSARVVGFSIEAMDLWFV
jgi:hypothetical protein